MSKRLFLIFNHRFTAAQEADALRSLGVETIVYPPTEVADLWRQIPPDMPELREYLKPVREWLAANAVTGDYVLIQGDFGACCLMVSFAEERGFIPVYSTTRRDATEEPQADGTVRLIHRFEHEIFRRYGI
ncbi:MAG: CRISPR-associated protein Csx20 [Syntrophobacteraceae bacterium]